MGKVLRETNKRTLGQRAPLIYKRFLLVSKYWCARHVQQLRMQIKPKQKNN